MMTDPVDVDDLLQEIFVRIHTHIETLDEAAIEPGPGTRRCCHQPDRQGRKGQKGQSLPGTSEDSVYVRELPETNDPSVPYVPACSPRHCSGRTPCLWSWWSTPRSSRRWIDASPQSDVTNASPNRSRLLGASGQIWF